MSSLCRYDSVDRETDLGNTDSDGIYIDVRTGLTSTRKPGSHLSGSLLQTSNEYGETSAGFQRTASAQTTLREATRILSTMPRGNNSEATGLSSAPTPLMMLPAGGSSVAMDDDDDDDDDNGSRYHDKKVDLFLRLST
ncbi:unnamed protein product [Heterobilharzia americana]|nr:unnamed protein product [Heterobilharzia americana]